MMVCRYDAERLLLILQIDHSRVAGLLAAHWGNEEFARLSPYSSMVLAAQEHDNGWWDWEVKPTINAEGRLTDYIGFFRHLGHATWLDFYRNGIERLAKQDPYAGLIVLMHGEGLLTQGKGLLTYMPDYSGVPPVKDFLDEREVRRQALLRTVRSSAQFRGAATDEHIWLNYKYMEVFDQLGQFICNRYPLNNTERKNGPSNTLSGVPVAPGKSDTGLTVNVKDEWNAVVTPYPFDVDPLPVPIAARILPDRVYTSQEDLLSEYYPAQRVTYTYTLYRG